MVRFCAFLDEVCRILHKFSQWFNEKSVHVRHFELCLACLVVKIVVVSRSQYWFSSQSEREILSEVEVTVGDQQGRQQQCAAVALLEKSSCKLVGRGFHLFYFFP